MGILGIPTVLKFIRPRFPSLPTRRPLGGALRSHHRLAATDRDCLGSLIGDLAGAAPASRPSPPAVARPQSLPCPEPGVLCTAPAGFGAWFCRNLRIRADPTLFSPLYTQYPRRSGAWAPTRPRVALVLILRLRHEHEPG